MSGRILPILFLSFNTHICLPTFLSILPLHRFPSPPPPCLSLCHHPALSPPFPMHRENLLKEEECEDLRSELELVKKEFRKQLQSLMGAK